MLQPEPREYLASKQALGVMTNHTTAGAVQQQPHDDAAAQQTSPGAHKADATGAAGRHQAPNDHATEDAAVATRHRIPLQLLFRNHWRQVILYIMVDIVYGVLGVHMLFALKLLPIASTACVIDSLRSASLSLFSISQLL